MEMSEAAYELSKQEKIERIFRQCQECYPKSWNCRPSRVPASRKNLTNKIKLINQPFLLI